MPTDLSRRDVLRLGLVVAGAAGLAACTTASNGSPTPTDPGGPEDPDRALRAEIGRDESRLVALYAAAAAVLTGAVASRVAAVGARHDAYRQAIDPDGLATASATASGTPGASTAATEPALPPVTASTAVRVLTAAETAAATARATQAASAVDPSLARVVVLAGAGAASAAAVLATGRAR
ncbi:MAG: twin-arginine translocation signal domain-containing protein [Actinomycetales bacterium]|nr:twin-arginine translocation signal domain-containing protein [Actinomycetales bacterium]